jgi:hypothetical protein
MYENSIEGFVYEEGYRYYLKVLKIHFSNPSMDGPNYKYKLIEIMDKKK